MYIGREYRLIVVVYLYGRVSPPEKRLRIGSPVEQFYIDFEIRLIRIKPEAGKATGAKHSFHFAAPHGNTTIGMFLNGMFNRKVGREGLIVLSQVKFDSTRNPRAWLNQCRLDNLIIINKMPVLVLSKAIWMRPPSSGKIIIFRYLFRKSGIPLLICFSRPVSSQSPDGDKPRRCS